MVSIAIQNRYKEVWRICVEMLEKSEYWLNLRRSIALMLVAVMIYMLIFGGIDLSLFKWGEDKVEHVAIIEQGDGYKIYENNDSSDTLELTMDTPKEESLVSVEDEMYDYKSLDESSDIYFNPDFKSGEPSLKINKAGIKIEMSPVIMTTAAVGKADGYNKEEGTYEKVYSEDTFGEGIALEYTPITSGVKENIILNAPTDINEFSYILNVVNLTAKLIANNLILYNAEGEEEYTISAPIMYDNNGEESYNIQITEEIIYNSKYKITIIPDKE